MTVVLLGASSQIGVFLLPLLLDAGHRVVAVSRKAPVGGTIMNPSLRWTSRVDELEADDPVDALVSCGPLGLAVNWVDQLKGLTRCVAFSSSSVHSKENLEIEALRDAEEMLRAHCRRAGSALCLLRPTLIYGCGRDRNVSLLASFGRRFGWIPVSRKADGLRQPVHAGDLALAALRALQCAPPLDHQGELCGGSTLSYRAMVEAVAACDAVNARVVALNPGLFRALLRLVGWLPAAAGLSAEMVDRQSMDLVFDDESTRRRLGIATRTFCPSEKDFRVPSEAAALQLPLS